jgi:hypothetical protein
VLVQSFGSGSTRVHFVGWGSEYSEVPCRRIVHHARVASPSPPPLTSPVLHAVT